VGDLLDPPSLPGFPFPTSFQTKTPAGNHTFEGPTIIGTPMPGQWLLTKATRQFGWQEQQGSFQSGATIVPKGDPLMHIEYEVRIFEAGTMSDFILVCGTILKKAVVAVPGVPASAALGIDDPILKILGVKSVVVDFVEFPKNPLVASGGKGAWVGKVGFIEYRKPLPALPVPSQEIPDPGAVTPAAAANLATAGASVTAGAAALQAAGAKAFVPPRP
jgi:hypothetical protein